MKFHGKIEDLQSSIASLGYQGDWEALSNAQYRFTSTDGAVVNWWSSTGTVQFQGPTPARDGIKDKLETTFQKLNSASAPAFPAVPAPSATKNGQNKRVFVVHGHDQAARDQLELVLHRLGLDPFVLANTGGGGLTLIEALEKEIGPESGRCRFGIVLLTPDDMGYAKSQGAEKAEPRARQNVVLEMGMVLAALRRPNVVILKKGHLEIPSDVQGIIYIGFNDHVRETVPKLVERLNDAGFSLDTTAISRATG